MGMGPTAIGSKIPNVLMHNWSPPRTSINKKNNYSSLKRKHSGRLPSQSLVIETNVTGTAEDQSVARRLILLRHAKSSWEFPSLRVPLPPSTSHAVLLESGNQAHRNFLSFPFLNNNIKKIRLFSLSLFLVSSLFFIRNCCQTQSLAAQIFQRIWVVSISKANQYKLYPYFAFLFFFFLVDHDRPLSKAGQDDAIKVSQKLQQLGWIPQLILSSDAVRTRQTLKIMQQHVQGFLESEVHFISSFYSVAAMDGQTAEHLRKAICKYSRDEILTVLCMGHNRGWEEAASMFTGAVIELKTCNAALLETTGKSWEEAFAVAGLGGWKLQGIVTPTSST